MNKSLTAYLRSSIGKKQIVALSGLGLILFVLAHLAGNFFIFAGPIAYNHYADKLQSFGIFLYFLRIGLIATFVTHIFFTVWVVTENIKARPVSYSVSYAVGNRSLATRTMALSGTVILIFIIFHLRDFTFHVHHGPSSILRGEDLGLYGLVVNSFLNPVRAVLYILAVGLLGMHLSHAVKSVFQTIGFYHEGLKPIIEKVSVFFGFIIFLGYASIPVITYLQFK